MQSMMSVLERWQREFIEDTEEAFKCGTLSKDEYLCKKEELRRNDEVLKSVRMWYGRWQG